MRGRQPNPGTPTRALPPWVNLEERSRGNQAEILKGWGFCNVPPIPRRQGELLMRSEHSLTPLCLRPGRGVSLSPDPYWTPRRSAGHIPSARRADIEVPTARLPRQNGVAMATGASLEPQTRTPWGGPKGRRALRSGAGSAPRCPGQGQVCCRGIRARTTHSRHP